MTHLRRDIGTGRYSFLSGILSEIMFSDDFMHKQCVMDFLITTKEVFLVGRRGLTQKILLKYAVFFLFISPMNGIPVSIAHVFF